MSLCKSSKYYTFTIVCSCNIGSLARAYLILLTWRLGGEEIHFVTMLVQLHIISYVFVCVSVCVLFKRRLYPDYKSRHYMPWTFYYSYMKTCCIIYISCYHIEFYIYTVHLPLQDVWSVNTRTIYKQKYTKWLTTRT